MKWWSALCGWLGFGPNVQAPAVPPPAASEHDGDPAWERESARADTDETGSDLVDGADARPEQTWWMRDGETIVAQPRLELLDAADLSLFRELQDVVENPDVDLPHLPHVPQRVLTLLRQPNINYPGIAKVLSRDQTLSAAVLRVANSAAFAASREITNLEVALGRLGMKNIQGLMLKESIKAVTIRRTAEGRSTAELLWKKSVASAVVMENLAYSFRIKPDEAYIGGLLHDIGEVVLLRLIRDHEKVIRQKVPEHVMHFVWQEYHERMGGALSEHWNLPEVIRPLLSDHHSEVDDYDPLRTHKCLVQIADMLVSLMGYGQPLPYDILGSTPAQILGFGTQKNHIDALEYLPELVRAELNLPL